MNSIGAIGESTTGKRKIEKPSDIPGLRRKKAKKVKSCQNVVFIVDLQSSRSSARTAKRKSAKKVESSFLILKNPFVHFCQKELLPLLWNAGWTVSKEFKAPLHHLLKGLASHRNSKTNFHFSW